MKVSNKVMKTFFKSLRHHFPDLPGKIKAAIPDLRDKRGKVYALEEVVYSAILMFLLGEGSRNSYNNDREDGKLTRNIRKALKIRMVHGDTFNDLFSVLPEEHLEELKAILVKNLIVNKVFYNQRLLGKYYVVAIDATGTHSLKDDPDNSCLTHTSKNGKTNHFNAVLEAKLVTSNGFCISLASTWIENTSDNYDKQDCETEAFKRLSKKVKKYYPRLPILMTGDALYSNNTVMNICRENSWEFLTVFKHGRLKFLQEETSLRPDKNTLKETHNTIEYLNRLDYKEHNLCWIKYCEAGNKFEWLGSFIIKNFEHAKELQRAARLRWKIENEGFNTQKNSGFNMSHLYNRINFLARKNFYQCLQIAHLFQQLTLLMLKMRNVLNSCPKISIQKIKERIRNILIFNDLSEEQIKCDQERKIQARYP